MEGAKELIMFYCVKVSKNNVDYYLSNTFDNKADRCFRTTVYSSRLVKNIQIGNYKLSDTEYHFMRIVETLNIIDTIIAEKDFNFICEYCQKLICY